MQHIGYGMRRQDNLLGARLSDTFFGRRVNRPGAVPQAFVQVWHLALGLGALEHISIRTEELADGIGEAPRQPGAMQSAAQALAGADRRTKLRVRALAGAPLVGGTLLAFALAHLVLVPASAALCTCRRVAQGISALRARHRLAIFLHARVTARAVHTPDCSAGHGVLTVSAWGAPSTTDRALELPLQTAVTLRTAPIGLESSWSACLTASFVGIRKEPRPTGHTRGCISAFAIFDYGTFCSTCAGPACFEITSEPVLETTLK